MFMTDIVEQQTGSVQFTSILTVCPINCLKQSLCRTLPVIMHNLPIFQGGISVWFFVACLWCRSFGDVSPYARSY